MSSRIASFCVAGLLSLGLLSGCPTRSASEPQGHDASADTSTTNITVPDDAGVDAQDLDDAFDPAVDGAPEQQKLPPRAPLDIGLACSVNAQCATGSCVDGVCCSSAACNSCQSCGVLGSLGACSPIPKLTEDPRFACIGSYSCDGAGHCALNNGNTCRTGSQCISGFCADGVCCESTCDQQCYSCNQLYTRGVCKEFAYGPDDSAAQVCTGTSRCALGIDRKVACLLVDGESCEADADCVSHKCFTYFADSDGDGFGSPHNSIKRCDWNALPPVGYTDVAGDCCDFDSTAHPGIATDRFLSSPDACGNFDYDCSGRIEKLHDTGTCAGYPAGTTPDCGKTCDVRLVFQVATLYTQACR
jgi:hypothetical protein